MLSKLFPFKIHLNILQLVEYNPKDFWQWIIKNFNTRELEGKKPLVATTKVRLISTLSFLLALIIFLVLGQWSWFWSTVITILLLTQDYLLISLVLLILWPLENYQRTKIKIGCKRKIEKLKKSGLKVIGITGSYGKTTTKDFLYQILRNKYQVLKTPESFNTILGVAKIVDLELDDSYQYFICEYGAYRKGSIQELVETIKPDLGILTGINEQHLEQIGSVEDIISEKFTLVKSIDPKQPIAINLEDKYIADNYHKFDRNYIGYNSLDTKYEIRNTKYDTNSSKFDLILDGKTYSAATPVFGQSNLQNILAAATMAYQLDVEPKEIVKAIANLKPTPHRLEVKQFENGITYIDNAFSSNVDGFKIALEFLQTFKKRPKILVTPGIVLLGDRSDYIHHELGKLAAKACDRIILVGRSERTKALEEGIKDSEKVLYIDQISEVWPTVTSLNLKNPVVLIENDLPDNY